MPFPCPIRSGTPRISLSETIKSGITILITVPGSKRVDLKVFQKAHGLRKLSFASPQELMDYMHLTPGSVSPLGLLNDPEHRVHFYLDRYFSGNKIGIHPNDNTATVWMQSDALMSLIQEKGNEAEYVDI